MISCKALIPFESYYGVIYKITNKINGHYYIGQTIRKGISFLNYYGSGNIIRNALNKYGKENFIKEILDFAKTKKDLNEKEKFWISYLKPIYNISKGGNGGNLGEEVNKKISKSLKGKKFPDKIKHLFSIKYKGKNNPFYGRKHTPETREKMKKNSKHLSGKEAPMYGKKHTKETLKIQSELKTGINNPFYNKKQSQEHIYKRIKKSKDTQRKNKKSSKISKLNIKNNYELIIQLKIEGYSARYIAKKINCSPTSIIRIYNKYLQNK